MLLAACPPARMEWLCGWHDMFSDIMRCKLCMQPDLSDTTKVSNKLALLSTIPDEPAVSVGANGTITLRS